MQTVQQILNSKSGQVLSVVRNTKVYDALAMMAQHDVGALIVLERGKLIGVFSERDYARKVILHGKSSKNIPVAEIMTESVVSVRPEHTVQDCMAIMTDKRVRHLPVVDDAGVVGVISIGDVVKAMLDDQQFLITQLEHYITT